ncbi:MAG: hypothetical protein RL758_134 [Pseudomonadota bacterium]|jgi:hypothetical protein
MGIETLVTGGLGLVGGILSSRSQSKAADSASAAQVASTEAGIAENRRQFDAIQALLQPYVTGGTGALGQQQTLLGLSGADAQAQAIQALQNSPQFTSLLQQGENSILQNASATGGLRGGNTQAALAQFSPALLSATINDQYNKLGGLASMGLGAATQTGNFGQASTNNVTNLLQQQGSALAGNALAQGKIQSNLYNSFASGIGSLLGGIKF